MNIPGNDEHLYNYTDREDKQTLPLVAGAAPFGHADSSKFERMGMLFIYVLAKTLPTLFQNTPMPRP